jgi:DNA-directed RNA polymerase specialized sigma24 family protein
MAIDQSITHWIAGLKTGDTDAAQRLWDRYIRGLLALARCHLGAIAIGGADEEDVAQSVFKSLCLGAQRGKFPDLLDRNNLWTLLVVICAYKSRDLIRREKCLKRGGGRVLNEAALAASEEPFDRIEEVIRSEPTPEFAVQVAEQCELMLSQLTDVRRKTAEFKLQGFTNREIAEQMGCGLRTVERRLEDVRRSWMAPA